MNNQVEDKIQVLQFSSLSSESWALTWVHQVDSSSFIAAEWLSFQQNYNK